MARAARALLCAAAAIPPGAAAAELDLKPAKTLSYTEAGASFVHETVSNQPNNWTESQLDFTRKFAERKILIGRYVATERFGLRDNTLAIGGYHPLGERTTAFAEVQASENHAFLPRNALQLQVTHTLGGGFGAIAGLKHVRYDVPRIDIAELGLEYYFSTFRVALTSYPSHSSTAGSAGSYRLQIGHYYGAENNVQLVVSSGDEVDAPVAAGVIVRSPVRSAAVFGRHWFARDWAVTYTAGRTHLGPSTRDAVGVGLRFRF